MSLADASLTPMHTDSHQSQACMLHYAPAYAQEEDCGPPPLVDSDADSDALHLMSAMAVQRLSEAPQLAQLTAQSDRVLQHQRRTWVRRCARTPPCGRIAAPGSAVLETAQSQLLLVISRRGIIHHNHMHRLRGRPRSQSPCRLHALEADADRAPTIATAPKPQGCPSPR